MSSCFFLDSRANSRREHAIRVVICINGAKCTTTMGCAVTRQAWENEDIPADIRQRMDLVKQGMKRWELRLCGRRPSTDEIRNRLHLLLREGDPGPEKARRGIIALLDEFMAEQRVASQWSEGTVALLMGLRRHLGRFCPGEDCDFFDQAGLEAWLRYLREKAGLEESTVRKLYRELRWFLSWALRKGYMGQRAVLLYRPKYKLVPKPVLFLTKRELLTLYYYKVPANGATVRLRDAMGRQYTKVVRHSSALKKARDLFCFCAFTSLRYSDMARLRRSDVSGGMLYVTTQKTHDRLPIDLCVHAREILNRYAGASLADDRVLPPLSCQKMNLYLKELCELCGFRSPVTRVCWRGGQRCEEVLPKWALVGTHAARRTFICFALSQGIPPQVVMKWTGHSDYKTMRPYIDVASEVSAAAMRKLSAAWK